jgi:hypothetical protein
LGHLQNLNVPYLILPTSLLVSKFILWYKGMYNQVGPVCN